MKPSGSVFYKDDYDTIFRIEWQTVGAVIDLTTMTFQPYIWGKTKQGYIQNGILFRLGIITIHRHVIKPIIDGYEIIAEGVSQYTDYVQMNFPCETGPIDLFKHHLNSQIIDEVGIKILEGSHWADPDDPDDIDAIWGDINLNGSSLELTGIGGLDILQWIDVWY